MPFLSQCLKIFVIPSRYDTWNFQRIMKSLQSFKIKSSNIEISLKLSFRPRLLTKSLTPNSDLSYSQAIWVLKLLKLCCIKNLLFATLWSITQQRMLERFFHQIKISNHQMFHHIERIKPLWPENFWQFFLQQKVFSFVFSMVKVENLTSRFIIKTSSFWEVACRKIPFSSQNFPCYQ